jgi:hypothetical protein
MVAALLLFFGLFSNHYVVRFEGDAAVREGMPLAYRGVEIGAVSGVGVGPDLHPFAEVKVKRKFAHLFRQGCAVTLERDRLELTGVDREAPALPDGATVPGLAGAMDYLKFGYDKAKGMLRDLEFRKEYEDLLREMERAWEKGKGAFREEWPEFKRRLKELQSRVGPELKKEFERAAEAWEGKAEKE